MKEETLVFDINFQGEKGAGLLRFSDTVRVSFGKGFAGQDDRDSAIEIISQALREYYDGATVSLEGIEFCPTCADHECAVHPTSQWGKQ